MDPSNSLSVMQLDDWIRETFNTIFIPTLLDHYGAQEDPWTLDLQKAVKASNAAQSINADVHFFLAPSTPALSRFEKQDNRNLSAVSQEIVDALYPRQFHQLSHNDLIVRIVCVLLFPLASRLGCYLPFFSWVGRRSSNRSSSVPLPCAQLHFGSCIYGALPMCTPVSAS